MHHTRNANLDFFLIQKMTRSMNVAHDTISSSHVKILGSMITKKLES